MKEQSRVKKITGLAVLITFCMSVILCNMKTWKVYATDVDVDIDESQEVPGPTGVSTVDVVKSEKPSPVITMTVTAVDSTGALENKLLTTLVLDDSAEIDYDGISVGTYGCSARYIRESYSDTVFLEMTDGYDTLEFDINTENIPENDIYSSYGIQGEYRYKSWVWHMDDDTQIGQGYGVDKPIKISTIMQQFPYSNATVLDTVCFELRDVEIYEPVQSSEPESEEPESEEPESEEPESETDVSVEAAASTSDNLPSTENSVSTTAATAAVNTPKTGDASMPIWIVALGIFGIVGIIGGLLNRTGKSL